MAWRTSIFFLELHQHQKFASQTGRMEAGHTTVVTLSRARETGDTTAVTTLLKRVIKAMEPPSHSGGGGGNSSAIVDSSSSHQHWEPTKSNYLTLAVVAKEYPAALRIGFAPHRGTITCPQGSVVMMSMLVIASMSKRAVDHLVEETYG